MTAECWHGSCSQFWASVTFNNGQDHALWRREKRLEKAEVRTLVLLANGEDGNCCCLGFAGAALTGCRWHL